MPMTPRKYSPKTHMFYMEFNDSDGKPVVIEWRGLTARVAQQMHKLSLKKMRIYTNGKEVAAHITGREEMK